MSDSLRILWLATKPPWPPIDGGRLVMALTVEQLARLGHRISVVAPGIEPIERPPLEGVELHLATGGVRPLPLAALEAILTGAPTTVVRHRRLDVRRLAEALAEPRSTFDLVHIEQPQAFSALPRPPAPGPTVLRIQNIESDLWRQQAEHSAGLRCRWLMRESRALARFEARVARSADLVIALTEEDRQKIARISATDDADEARTLALSAPFDSALAAADRELEGDPPLVLLGNVGWPPNRDALDFFLGNIWPEIAERYSSARLHLFGLDHPPAVLTTALREKTILHHALTDSRTAFASRSILLVPLRIASGVRMKILEAWSRGVAVIASDVAARGLEAVDRQHLLIANDAAATLDAIDWLSSPVRRESLIANARALLQRRHSPSMVARGLEAAYRGVLAAG